MKCKIINNDLHAKNFIKMTLILIERLIKDSQDFFFLFCAIIEKEKNEKSSIRNLKHASVIFTFVHLKNMLKLEE